MKEWWDFGDFECAQELKDNNKSNDKNNKNNKNTREIERELGWEIKEQERERENVRAKKRGKIIVFDRLWAEKSGPKQGGAALFIGRICLVRQDT